LLLAGVYENLKATLEKLEPRFTLRLRRDGKSPERYEKICIHSLKVASYVGT